MAYAPTEILKKKKIHQLCEVFNLFLYTCYIQNTSRSCTLSRYVLSVSYKKITDPIQCDRKYCPNIDISKTKRNGTDPEKGSCCKKRKVVANFHHKIPKLIRICYSLKKNCHKCKNICRYKLIV